VSDAAASLASLAAEQSSLIARSRDYLRAARERGVDVAMHPECYLSGWSNVRGNARLLCLAGQRGARLKLGARRVKDALNVMRQGGQRVIGDAPADQYDDLVVTWCRASDFAEDGTYRDRYFRTSSRDTPRTLWFAIALDEPGHGRRDPNVRVFARGAGEPALSPAMLAGEVLRGPRKRGDGRVPWLSGIVTHAENLVVAVSATLRAGQFRRVILPYEAQPFQHAVYRAVKRIAPQVRTLGYLHSALPPVPADLSYRPGAPELLLVHGSAQRDILERLLGWPREAMRTIPSLRYRADDTNSLARFIFLPMDFSDSASIVGEFRTFLAAAPAGSLAPLTVRNHPVMRESKRHLQLERQLGDLLAQYADRFSESPDAEPLSVFIGATAAIVEALERGVSVVHICSQPLTEAHTPEVWRGFEVKRFGRFLFRYRLRDRGSYISFGAGDGLFEQYIREGELR
jgi:hypothetical protein